MKDLFSSLNFKHRIHPRTLSHEPVEISSLERTLSFLPLIIDGMRLDGLDSSAKQTLVLEAG